MCAELIGSTMRLTIVYNKVCDYVYILVIIKEKISSTPMSLSNTPVVG